MTKLILVNQGQTDWDHEHRIQGLIDMPLNTGGNKQARAIAEGLSDMKIDVIYSSGLLRAYQTAEITAKLHKLKVKKLTALNDINYGLWQGMLVSEAGKKHKKSYRLWQTSPLYSKPPKGEGIKEAYQRVSAQIEKLAFKHKDHVICVISHPAINALIQCYFLKQDLNDAWTVLPELGTWKILEVGSGR
ncbi:MAG: histidine phosphatase family protein, partial [Candidatus Omnitrophota bacterium]|nr:histidine phosphatase family protein [Candidatus Omnitrophota bacterium]